MGKSMKTAFIRITRENDTKNGLKVYSKQDLISLLEDWQSSLDGLEYWLIEHDADIETATPHYHIVLRFKKGTSYPFDSLKVKFPYGNIESARNVKACVQYLVHYNDASKRQYQWSDIVTNCQDMTPFKVKTVNQAEVTLQTIIDDIDSGKIREYNQFEKIPIEIWAKYKPRIENALTYYRERTCMDKNRKIDVVFMSGDTGSGKTTFAKQYCTMAKKSFCVSSSSNDPMQDYKGEDVLILDDMRDDSFTFTDLLKVLDNHTKSTVRSRYNNKAFIGEMIIITSFKPLADWYFNVPRESKEQLYRRIKVQYQFTFDKIKVFGYNEQLCKYEFQVELPNTIVMSKREQVSLAYKMLDAMGISYSEEYKVKMDEAVETWQKSENGDSDNPFLSDDKKESK